MTGDLRGPAARLNAISCVGDTHALVAVDVQTGTPLDPIAAIERRLAEEHAAAPADGTLWHRGARAAFARAIDIVREATA